MSSDYPDSRTSSTDDYSDDVTSRHPPPAGNVTGGQSHDISNATHAMYWVPWQHEIKIVHSIHLIVGWFYERGSRARKFYRPGSLGPSLCAISIAFAFALCTFQTFWHQRHRLRHSDEVNSWVISRCRLTPSSWSHTSHVMASPRWRHTRLTPDRHLARLTIHRYADSDKYIYITWSKCVSLFILKADRTNWLLDQILDHWLLRVQ